MGADIHIYCEVRNKETGKWEIQTGVNRWINRDRLELMAGPKPDADEREVKRLEHMRNRINRLDSGDALKHTLKEEGIEHLYQEGMQLGAFDINYFKENLTAEQFEKIAFCEIEDGFVLEPDFLPLGRNYDAFAILADVRNGYGLAGISTGRGFNIIAPPKGVPDDASDFYNHKVDAWEGDGHSHSYFTVEELKVFNWDQTTEKTGLVELLPDGNPFGKSYFEMKEAGETIPQSYFGGGSGIEITKGEADALYKQLKGNHSMEEIAKYLPGAKEGVRINVRLRWEEDYRSASGNYYQELVHNIPSKYPEAADDEIRYVFFFDN